MQRLYVGFSFGERKDDVRVNRAATAKGQRLKAGFKKPGAAVGIYYGPGRPTGGT